MAPRWAVGALATWCLLLVAARAAPTPKDGFLVPLASNDAWDYYEFNVTGQIQITSATPFNVSRGAKDTRAAGSVLTNTGQLTNSKGEVVAIYQTIRTVVGDNYNVYGLKGTRVIQSITTLIAEFGTPEKGYFDDAAIVVNIVNKRLVNPKTGEDYVDYDAVISGGTGRFLGAIGTMQNKPLAIEKNTASVLKVAFAFKIWVPRNLPTPKGPISGRRRAL